MTASKVIHAGAGVATVYTDDFNRADGAPGSSWTTPAGDYLIASNLLVRQGGGDYIEYVQAMPSSDHYVQAKVYNNTSAYVVVHARNSGTGGSQNCYMGHNDPGGTYIIGKLIAGTYSDVITGSGPAPVAGDTHRLEVQGSQQRLYVNGALVLTGNDTSITAGTGVGLNSSPGGSYDDFEAGTFATTLAGYCYIPGTANNVGELTVTAGVVTALTTSITFTARVLLPGVQNPGRTVIRWNNVSCSLGFDAITNLPRMLVAATPATIYASANAGSVPSDVPVWIKTTYTRGDGLMNYWYSTQDVRTPAEVTWTQLGTSVTPTGSGNTPVFTGSGFVFAPGYQRNASNINFWGNVYYLSEEIDGVKRWEVDYQGPTFPVPAAGALALYSTPANPSYDYPTPSYITWTPQKTVYAEDQYKDEWIGDKRMWPIANGYIRHGVAAGGNYSTIFTAAIAPPTDLDIRWYGTHLWSSSFGPFSQWDVNGNQRCWLIEYGSGQARASLSTDGNNQFMTPLITTGFTGSQPGGIRITRVQSTGLVRLWFSTDGVNWIEQVGGQATVAAGTPLFNGTALIRIGGYNSGVSGLVIGTTIYAELRNGIDGPIMYRVGSKSLRKIARKQASWTCETGQTVTQNGGANAIPWIYPTVTADDLKDAYKGEVRTWPGGDGYIETPGTVGNILSTPHRSTFNPSGSPTTMGIIFKVTPVTWADEGFARGYFTHWIGGAGGGGFYLQQRYGQWLCFTNDGSGATQYFPSNNFTSAFVNGEPKWGAFILTGGNAYWWWRDEGGPWNVFGGGAHTNIAACTADLYVGGFGPASGSVFNGRIYRMELYDGANANGTPDGGTCVFQLDRDSFLNVGRRAATIKTKNAAAWYLDPTIGTATTPNVGQLPTEFTIVAKIMGPTGGSPQTGLVEAIACQNDSTSASSRTWALQRTHGGMNASGELRFEYHNGVSTYTTKSLSPIPVITPTDPEELAVSVSSVVMSGSNMWYQEWTKASGSWVAQTANVGTPWIAQLPNYAIPIRIGHFNSGISNKFQGRIYYVEIRSGLDPAAGTVLWRFDPSEYVSGTSWTDARGQTWTLTSAAAIVKPFELDAVATVNRSGATPALIYPSVLPNRAKWDQSQWDDGTDWV